ncbi:hypothetical protein BC628DRAFT_1281695, partial [Trametes gibbosa]
VYLVGIIPGPGKPSLAQINHCLKPLVDELLVFWESGIFFSRTAKFVTGRLVRCALVPLVCDLPAARQTAGFGAHNAKYFCSVCNLEHSDIDNLDMASWPPRTAEAHRKAAWEWKAKESVAQREAAFKENSTRWSELLRLPYWDPIRYTVIDSMHNHYLGLLKHHCRSIWGMSISAEDEDHGESTTSPQPTEEEQALGVAYLNSGTSTQLASCKKAVLKYLCTTVGIQARKPSKDRLLTLLEAWVSTAYTGEGGGESTRRATTRSAATPEQVTRGAKMLETAVSAHTFSRKFNLAVLRALCEQNGLSDNGTKLDIAYRLIDMVCSVAGLARLRIGSSETTDGPTVNTSAGRSGSRESTPMADEQVTSVLGRTTLQQIHAELPLTELPSWISPVPSNVGTKARGKLSADQWHIFCVVNLPVILIRMWAPRGGRFTQMLDNYMHLVTEVVVGSLLEMSDDAIALYESSALEYLKGAKELYGISLTPNQHNSLHIPFFLRLFGPLHAIRTFFSERMNYLLQRQNTNLIFGQLELTFMKHSCRAANLRAILEEPAIRAQVAELSEAYEQLQGEDRRGTRLRESLSLGASMTSGPTTQKAIVLDQDCFRALITALNSKAGKELFIDIRELRRIPGTRQLLNRAQEVSSIQIGGVRFRSKDAAPKDSNAMCIVGIAGASPTATRIKKIFRYTYRDSDGKSVEGTYLFVLPYAELSAEDAPLDPYRKYPFVGGQLYYNDHLTGVVITPDRVVSHFARTPVTMPGIAAQCIHALSLDKV